MRSRSARGSEDPRAFRSASPTLRPPGANQMTRSDFAVSHRPAGLLQPGSYGLVASRSPTWGFAAFPDDPRTRVQPSGRSLPAAHLCCQETMGALLTRILQTSRSASRRGGTASPSSRAGALPKQAPFPQRFLSFEAFPSRTQPLRPSPSRSEDRRVHRGPLPSCRHDSPAVWSLGRPPSRCRHRAGLRPLSHRAGRSDAPLSEPPSTPACAAASGRSHAARESLRALRHRVCSGRWQNQRLGAFHETV